MQHTQQQDERRTRQSNDAQSDGKRPIGDILARYAERITIAVTGVLIVIMSVTLADIDDAVVLWVAYGGMLLGCAIGNVGLK